MAEVTGALRVQWLEDNEAHKPKPKETPKVETTEERLTRIKKQIEDKEIK